MENNSKIHIKVQWRDWFVVSEPQGLKYYENNDNATTECDISDPPYTAMFVL